jgi:two-component SAPR family response regulator
VYLIFIDDDGAAVEALLDILSFRYLELEVKHFVHPKPALDFVKQNKKNIACIVLDVMFSSDGKLEGGYKLGLEYYMRIKAIDQKIPIAIFSNYCRLRMAIPFDLSKIDITIHKTEFERLLGYVDDIVSKKNNII